MSKWLDYHGDIIGITVWLLSCGTSLLTKIKKPESLSNKQRLWLNIASVIGASLNNFIPKKPEKGVVIINIELKGDEIMGAFSIFSLVLSLVPGLVKGIQVIHGDKLAGADKAQIAQDALKVAVESASSILTGGNLVYSQVAAELAQIAINQTVTIAKSTGAYGKWTAIADAINTDTQVATAVIGGVVANPNLPPAPPAPVEAPGIAH